MRLTEQTDPAIMSGLQKGVIAAILVMFSMSFVILVCIAIELENLKAIESLVYIMLMAVMVLTCKVNILSVTIMAVLATIATDEEFIFKIISMLLHNIS